MLASLVRVTLEKSRICPLGSLSMARLNQGSKAQAISTENVGRENGKVVVFLNRLGGDSGGYETRRGEEGLGGRPRHGLILAPREGSWSLSTRRKTGGPRNGPAYFRLRKIWPLPKC